MEARIECAGVIWAVLSLLGCAPSAAVERSARPPVAAPASPPRPPVERASEQPVERATVAVVGVVHGASSATFETTKVLHSHDRLYLTLRADRAMVAQVAYCNARRTLSVYPANGSIPLAPGHEVRIPETQDFVVDTNLGLETIYVIASTQPLGAIDPRLQQLLSDAARQPDGSPCAAELSMTTAESRQAQGISVRPTGVDAPTPEPKSVTHPRLLSPANGIPAVAGEFRPRGIGLETAPGAGKTLQTDEAGIAIQAFTFQHDP